MTTARTDVAAAAPATAQARAPLVAALVVSAFLVAWGGLHYGFYTRNLLIDTPIYERYGDAIVHEAKVPYRDFAVEYPPGALPVFVAPSVVSPAGDFGRYARVFEALMLLCGAAASALVAWILTSRNAGLVRLVGGTLLAGLAPLALGPVVLSRFDLWPAALTVAAVAALLAGRHRVGGGALGAAIAAKVYPAVLLPLAVAYVWRRAGRREAAASVAALVAVAAAAVLPFVVLAPDGVWAAFSGQAGRPLQIESLGASLLLVAHHTWELPVKELSSHGSDNLEGSLPALVASVQSLLQGAVAVALWIAFARGPATPERLIRYSAGAICAFVALNKVLSPQFLVWLIPLVALLSGRRGLVAGVLFVASMMLTQLWFPSRYLSLVYELDPTVSWLVLARNAVLVALLATLAWPDRKTVSRA